MQEKSESDRIGSSNYEDFLNYIERTVWQNIDFLTQEENIDPFYTTKKTVLFFPEQFLVDSCPCNSNNCHGAYFSIPQLAVIIKYKKLFAPCNWLKTEK